MLSRLLLVVSCSVRWRSACALAPAVSVPPSLLIAGTSTLASECIIEAQRRNFTTYCVSANGIPRVPYRSSFARAFIGDASYLATAPPINDVSMVAAGEKRLPPVDGVVIAFRESEDPLSATQEIVHMLNGQDPLILLPALRRGGKEDGVTDTALKLMETGYLRRAYEEKKLQAAVLRNAGFSAFHEVPFPSFSYGIDVPRMGIISRRRAAGRLMDLFDASST